MLVYLTIEEGFFMRNFNESGQYILIDKKVDLNNLQIFKNSQYGANSTIYNYKNNELLKVFNTHYRIVQLNILENLSSLSTKSLLKIYKFLFINEQFYGYSMPKIKGSMLAYLDNNINLKDFLKSLTPVQEDLILLGNNNLSADDLNALNIIYNREENKTTLIDLESYGLCTNETKEEIVQSNCISLYFLILRIISENYNVYASSNKIIKEMCNKIININEIYDTPYNFYIKYINDLENKYNNSIDTIKDLRKILKK